MLVLVYLIALLISFNQYLFGKVIVHLLSQKKWRALTKYIADHWVSAIYCHVHVFVILQESQNSRKSSMWYIKLSWRTNKCKINVHMYTTFDDVVVVVFNFMKVLLFYENMLFQIFQNLIFAKNRTSKIIL